MTINTPPIPGSAAEAREERKSGNRRRGRAAQRSGDQAEGEVNRACDVYLRRGVARIEKRHPGAKFGAGGKPYIVGRDHCDREGWFVGSGRGIIAEVKTSNTARIPLRRQNGKPTITPDQWRRLEAAHRDGLLAGVLCRVTVQRQGRKVRRWFWLRWPAWVAAEAEAKRERRGYVPQDALEAHGAECDTEAMHGAPDFLRAALTVESAEAAA